MHLHSSDAHSVSHGSATPSEIVKRYFLSSKIFSCYSRSYPAQPRTSVVSKPEQNLVLLVRDPGTPHVQSVPELTGHFSTGRCPLSLTPFSAGPDLLYCRFRSFLQIGRVSQDVFQNCKTGNFIWPKRVCSFGDDHHHGFYKEQTQSVQNKYCTPHEIMKTNPPEKSNRRLSAAVDFQRGTKSLQKIYASQVRGKGLS